MACNCKKSLTQTLVDGAVGLTKTVLQLEQIENPETVEGRRNHCRTCEHSTKNAKGRLTLISICKVCKCNIKAKTAIKSEACPEGKWNKVIDSDKPSD